MSFISNVNIPYNKCTHFLLLESNPTQNRTSTWMLLSLDECAYNGLVVKINSNTAYIHKLNRQSKAKQHMKDMIKH